MTRARNRAVIVGTVLLAGAVASCTSPTDGLDTPLEVTRADALEARFQDGIHLLTQVEDMEAYPDALFEGIIVRDQQGCVRLGNASGSTVIWPQGFTADVSDDQIVLRDAGGSAVGAVGDDFRMAGGHVPILHEGLGFTEEDHELAVSRCPGDFWIATPGTVVTTE